MRFGRGPSRILVTGMPPGDSGLEGGDHAASPRALARSQFTIARRSAPFRHLAVLIKRPGTSSVGQGASTDPLDPAIVYHARPISISGDEVTARFGSSGGRTICNLGTRA